MLIGFVHRLMPENDNGLVLGFGFREQNATIHMDMWRPAEHPMDAESVDCARIGNEDLDADEVREAFEQAILEAAEAIEDDRDPFHDKI